MDIETYSKLAIRTANSEDMIGNACFGLGGEAGEILDLIKKERYHGKPRDEVKLQAEIGDVIWYLNALIVSCGYNWSDILEMNIKKLSSRYPDLKFDPERANNRDLEAEEKAMRS